jgi:hypothetical protein
MALCTHSVPSTVLQQEAWLPHSMVSDIYKLCTAKRGVGNVKSMQTLKQFKVQHDHDHAERYIAEQTTPFGSCAALMDMQAAYIALFIPAVH